LITENLLGDALGTIAQQAIARGKNLPQEDLAEMAKDPAKIAEMLDAYDRVVARTWREPSVVYYKDESGDPIPASERDEDTLYSDELDLADKIFTFQWVSGGSPDLEQFRQQFSAAMEGVSAEPGVEDSA
jgi:hypothetical protein